LGLHAILKPLRRGKLGDQPQRSFSGFASGVAIRALGAKVKHHVLFGRIHTKLPASSSN
jgi:hypothetical protein